MDGEVHEADDGQEGDVRRDAWIAGHGIRVVRIPNRVVIYDLDQALRLIADAAPK